MSGAGTSETAKASGRSDVRLSFDMAPMTVPASQASPIALMLNELVVNALNAFPDDRAGKLDVAIRWEAGRMVIVIADDGIGMASAVVSYSEGFGTRLVKSIVRQLRGDVAWRRASPGTVGTVSCPLSSIEIETENRTSPCAS